MIVGDRVKILPTRQRARFGVVVGLSPLVKVREPLAEIATDRANGRRRWVPLRNLQGLQAPAVK